MKLLKENYEGLEEFAELPGYLKMLLSEPEIQEALRKSDFNTLYRELQEKVPYSGVGEFTQLLVNLNIDPLNYLDHIPNSFLTSTSIKNINIPDHITSIDEFAFAHCGSLTSITIPNSVTSISSYVFTHCEKLKSITIPNKITKINSSTFFYCTGLTSIRIPDSITSIGDSAFYNCSGLTNITIPDSVKIIYTDAFNSCSHLTSVTIGNGVTRIRPRAFFDCSNLHDIRYTGTTDQWVNINLSPDWNKNSLIKTIHCIDDDIDL